MKKKTEWKTEIPETDGWYWIKYHGKNGTVICPCNVIHLKIPYEGEKTPSVVVTTAKNDCFTRETRKQFGFSAARFGPKIKEP